MDIDKKRTLEKKISRVFFDSTICRDRRMQSICLGCSLLSKKQVCLQGKKTKRDTIREREEENMLELVKETEYHKRKGKWTIFGTIFSFIMLVLACIFVVLSVAGIKSLSWYIDLPSIVIPLGITFFVLFASESLWDFFQGFSIVYGKKEVSDERISHAWYAMKTVLITIPIAGVFAFLVSVVAIIGYLFKPELLGPNLAVAILSMFYCCIAEILLIPTAVRLKKKVN